MQLSETKKEMYLGLEARKSRCDLLSDSVYLQVLKFDALKSAAVTLSKGRFGTSPFCSARQIKLNMGVCQVNRAV